MSDQDRETKMREKARELARDAHCRYCDRWQEGHHPAEKCPNDIRMMEDEILEALLDVARERADELAQARADLERAEGRVACS